MPYRIIPDIQVQLQGEPMLSYSYSIYKGAYDVQNGGSYIEAKLRIEDSNNPDYIGSVILDAPGNSFSYNADGYSELTSPEINDLIEVIEHYHAHPLIWSV